MRYKELDTLKGIGILLVLLGHSFIVYPINVIDHNQTSQLIHAYIYSFHMPLFFIISGFLYNVARTKQQSYKDFAVNKAKRLLIPYFFITIVDMIPRMLLPALVNQKTDFVDAIEKIVISGGFIWFIYTLFFVFMIFHLIKGIFNLSYGKYVFLAVLIMLDLFKDNIPHIELFTMNKVIFYLIFFSIGYIIKDNYDMIKNVLSKNVIVILAAIIFLLTAFRYDTNEVLSIIIPFLGIYIAWFICLKLKEGKISKFLQECGQFSLQIYVLEGFFLVGCRVILIKIFKLSNDFMIISSMFILQIALEYLFIKYFTNKIPIISFLLGNKYVKKDKEQQV
ncbi:acyltransferase family protein [Inconstantimicrobium mannanitabidum]|uniref:O-acetyltransferase n=1 Tax=Inconstantimicrobium mannanitabidum TaxID=1604901 RepID=A0ACB5RAS5_9CLOT|nr:acyltransferase [Clostridium sp. TW13]GKX66103.1 O-acetyltransferase [Clostridium sp. TW13]